MKIDPHGINQDCLFGLSGSHEVAGYTTEVEFDSLYREVLTIADQNLPSHEGVVTLGGVAFYIYTETICHEEMRFLAALYLLAADGRKVLRHGVILSESELVVVNVHDENNGVDFQRTNENHGLSVRAGIVSDVRGRKDLMLTHGGGIPSAMFPLTIE